MASEGSVVEKIANNTLLAATARSFMAVSLPVMLFGLSLFWGYISGQGEALAKVTERVTIIETRFTLVQALRDQQNAVLTAQMARLADNTDSKFTTILDHINSLSNDVSAINATLKAGQHTP